MTGIETVSQRVFSATTMIGDDVINPNGENLGEIEDFMIDLVNGKVVYAILSFEGVLGIGERLFAVPLSALRMDEDARCFVLDASREKLNNAPGFEPDQWPDMSDAEWAGQIQAYWRA